MKIDKTLGAITLLLTACCASCARILGIFIVPSKSHQILAGKLLTSLAEKGHEVTMISPYPLTTKVNNYRDIFLEEMLQFKEDHLQNLMSHNATPWDTITKTVGLFEKMADIFLSSKEVENLKKEKFDLIIQYALFSDSFLGLAHHFNAPVILFNTMGSVPMLDRIVGNTAPPSYVSSLSVETTFLQRVANTLSIWLYYGLLCHLYDYQQQALLTKYFPKAPALKELVNNISLVFINSHYSIESPRPHVPNLIQIGGFHVEQPKELPPDLKTFLNEAVHGAVFFSLGSNVKISSLPKEKVQAIINVLGKLNMKVLFKTEEEDMIDLPRNIKTGKWLPQTDILAHPNTKLFISHGGLLSTTEAVYFGVPVVGIPIFGDQRKNIADAVASGYAVKVDINELNEELFSTAVNEVLNNAAYRKNVELRSSLIRDQPIKPLDNAIFWVEHVLKHKGARHLKNQSVNLYLYQYLLLDVIAFIFVITFTAITITYKIVAKMFSFWRKLSKKIKSKSD